MESKSGARAKLGNGVTQSVGFHSRRRVHRVAEQAVARHLEADHAGDDRSGVEPDAQLELLVRPVPDAEVPHGLQEPQRHAGDLPGVHAAVAHRQARDHHVSVAYRLHLSITSTSIE